MTSTNFTHFVTTYHFWMIFKLSFLNDILLFFIKKHKHKLVPPSLYISKALTTLLTVYYAIYCWSWLVNDEQWWMDSSSSTCFVSSSELIIASPLSSAYSGLVCPSLRQDNLLWAYCNVLCYGYLENHQPVIHVRFWYK